MKPPSIHGRPLTLTQTGSNYQKSKNALKKKKDNMKQTLKCYFNYKRFSGKRQTLNVFMLHATTTSPFKCAQASEESQLISSAVCQQRGPDASQAAARGANERRREHLSFKSGDVVLLFNIQGFVLFFSSPGFAYRGRALSKGEGCRFKRFSLN